MPGQTRPLHGIKANQMDTPRGFEEELTEEELLRRELEKVKKERDMLTHSITVAREQAGEHTPAYVGKQLLHTDHDSQRILRGRRTHTTGQRAELESQGALDKRTAVGESGKREKVRLCVYVLV